MTKVNNIDHPLKSKEPHVLKNRDRIISLVRKQTTRYLKRTHKFGIEVPKTVKEALALDRKNGNTLWADTIAKEMKEVRMPSTFCLMAVLHLLDTKRSHVT